MGFIYKIRKGGTATQIAIGVVILFVMAFLSIGAAASAYPTDWGDPTIPTDGGGTTCAAWINAPDNYQDIFQKAASNYNVHPALVGAIFLAEHGGGWATAPFASSPKGASGPFQFMPDTWESNGVDANDDKVKDVQNIEDASFGAARYLQAGLSQHIGLGRDGTYIEDEINIKLAAGGYNWGYGNVDKLRGFLNSDSANIPDETRNYMANAWQYFQNLNKGCDVLGIIPGGGTAPGLGDTALPIDTSTVKIQLGATLHNCSVSTPVKCANPSKHRVMMGSLGQYGVSWADQKGEAVDIGAAARTPVHAPFGGTIVRNGSIHGASGTDGNYVSILSTDGQSAALLAHLANELPSGTVVQAGQIVGYLSPISWPHCHFELWINQQPVNAGQGVTTVDVWAAQKKALGF